MNLIYKYYPDFESALLIYLLNSSFYHSTFPIRILPNKRVLTTVSAVSSPLYSFQGKINLILYIILPRPSEMDGLMLLIW